MIESYMLKQTKSERMGSHRRKGDGGEAPSTRHKTLVIGNNPERFPAKSLMRNEDFPIIYEDDEVFEVEDDEEKDGTSKMVNLAGEIFQAKRIVYADDELKKRAEDFYSKTQLPSSRKFKKYDPSIYMDDFNKLMMNSRPWPCQIRSMEISLEPIRNTPAGEKLFGLLKRHLKRAESHAAKTRSRMNYGTKRDHM